MRSCSSVDSLFRTCATLGAVAAVLAGARAAEPVAAPAAAGAARVIYNFGGGTDGGYPDTDLVLDGDGNLYGMCVQGGAHGAGAVFELSPTPLGWTQTVLYSFTGGADGGQPYGGVTLDAQGNLYGTAVIGGSGGFCTEDGCGVVFKLTKTGDTWTQSVIHNFSGGEDGYGPGGPLTFDNLGNLYGMTPTGGLDGIGIIFELTPQPNGDWVETVIHTFTGGDDGGAASAGRLLIDASRNIFGVATVGGANGAGTAFELSPVPHAPWNFTTLYAFQGVPDAGFPYGGLTSDGQGNLYGTTYYDGANNLGSVYRLAKVNGTWIESVLWSFKGGSDGASSISGLVIGQDRSLYGTTSEGGTSGDHGTIFRLTPRANGQWAESIVYRFKGAPDGAAPYAGLVMDPAGTMYGATVHGGDDDDGAIFKFHP